MTRLAVYELQELLPCPLCRRVICHIAVKDATGADLNRDNTYNTWNVAVNDVK